MLQSAGVGKIPIFLKTKNTMDAKDVLYVPDLSINLLAVSKIAQFGRSVIFDQHGCKIVDKVMKVPQKSILGTATWVNGLYVLDVEKTTSYFTNTSQNGNIWHRRLGHLNRYLLDQLAKGMAIGVWQRTDKTSEACVKGKHSRKPFKSTGARCTKDLLELIHSDVCGPMPTASIGWAKYFVTFIDDFTRYCFVYFMNSKTDVVEKIKEFKNLVENQLNERIKALRTDNGLEYVNSHLSRILKNNGIIHEKTVAYSPEQNGLAERFNRTLLEEYAYGLRCRWRFLGWGNCYSCLS